MENIQNESTQPEQWQFEHVYSLPFLRKAAMLRDRPIHELSAGMLVAIMALDAPSCQPGINPEDQKHFDRGLGPIVNLHHDLSKTNP